MKAFDIPAYRCTTLLARLLVLLACLFLGFVLQQVGLIDFPYFELSLDTATEFWPVVFASVLINGVVEKAATSHEWGPNKFFKIDKGRVKRFVKRFEEGKREEAWQAWLLRIEWLRQQENRKVDGDDA